MKNNVCLIVHHSWSWLVQLSVVIYLERRDKMLPE